MCGPINWIPTEVDTETPNAARVYDYLLGGAHNFETDRQFGDQVASIVPAREFARNNRAFLRRVVNYLAHEAGIRQFLDLGSGVPTVGNVHEIAQRASPDCRVVYVDKEPVAVAHSEMILQDNELATVIHADLQHPATVLSHPRTQQLLDFSQPVTVLMCAVLHFIPDEADPPGIITAYRKHCAPAATWQSRTPPTTSTQQKSSKPPTCTRRRKPRARSAHTTRSLTSSTDSHSSTQAWFSPHSGAPSQASQRLILADHSPTEAWQSCDDTNRL